MTRADRDAIRQQTSSAYALHYLPALLDECDRLEAALASAAMSGMSWRWRSRDFRNRLRGTAPG